ncbi:MAG: M48 family metallopeptidase [Candidatus Methylacidiphilales bacterium]|nr:M48 family metallopeptidase [Candidatus Methylacidiphilales bacterium]
MDFFAHQDRARLLTRQWLAYYVLALAGTILATYVLVVMVLGMIEHEKRSPTLLREREGFTTGLSAPFPGQGWFDPGLFVAVTGATLILVAVGSGWKTLQLAGGGATVATLLGGRPVPPGTSDPDKRRLLNVVEEMAIAAGLPVPAVYVLDDEEGINAFAAGNVPSDAVIGVTRGTIERLTRDELQGVVAHEFSHILNGDMRLNVRLTCLTAGILFLAVIGRTLLESLRYARFSSGRKDKGGGALLLVVVGAGLGLMLIGSIGHFFASLIQAAVSRQREFLADASAVQFTRNPEGIGGALLKIAGLGRNNRLRSSHAVEAGHFFFSDSVTARWLDIGATHPPLEERIRRVAPQLLEEAHLESRAVRPGGASTSSAPYSGTGAGLADSLGVAALAPGTTVEPVVRDSAWPEAGAEHLAYAADLLANLPGILSEAVREPYGARALVFALLLSHDPEVEARQLASLQRMSEPLLRQEALLLRGPLRRLDRRVLLPLVDLAQPTLRLLSPAAYREFRLTLEVLIEEDGEIGLLEYALLKLVKRRLDPLFPGMIQVKEGVPAREPRTLEAAWPDIQTLLAALAYQNGDAAAAFAAGTAVYGAAPGQSPLPQAEHCGLSEADQAMERLIDLPESDRRVVVEACARTVMADGNWNADEGELLRAIGDHLGCSIPPFLDRS